MESIGKDCTELKHKYDECFNKWYSEKFLKGQLADSPCQDLFDDYRACLLVALKEKQLDKLLQETRKSDESHASVMSSSTATAATDSPQSSEYREHPSKNN